MFRLISSRFAPGSVRYAAVAASSQPAGSPTPERWNSYHLLKSLLLNQITVGLGAPVSKELPDIAHFLDLVEIQIGHDHFLLVPRAFNHELAAGRAEITLAVEFADVP